MTAKKNLLGKESLAEKMRKVKEELEATDVDIEKSIDKKNLKPTVKTDPKLFVSGRLDRKNYNYVAKSLLLSDKLDNDIKAYCRGGDLAILNYLIMEGLKIIKKSEQIINVDMTDIERDLD